MNPALIIAIVAVVILVGIAIWWIATDNRFRRLRIKVDEGRSTIEVALQNRCDKLTALLDIVKGFAAHEVKVLGDVVRARRGANITELEDVHQRSIAQATGLLAVAEQYPQLRSVEAFQQLQNGVMEAERSIQAARRLYNSNVTQFNTAIEMFPPRIVATRKGLTPFEFFEATSPAYREPVKMTF
ncbi:MAG: LemA family protein [Promicromonosporaceae bacterium]|nr:LemA family protein [Promicromonosporaceae bacterium]